MSSMRQASVISLEFTSDSYLLALINQMTRSKNMAGEKFVGDYCTISINPTQPCDCDTLDQFDTSTRMGCDRDKNQNFDTLPQAP